MAAKPASKPVLTASGVSRGDRASSRAVTAIKVGDEGESAGPPVAPVISASVEREVPDRVREETEPDR